MVPEHGSHGLDDVYVFLGERLCEVERKRAFAVVHGQTVGDEFRTVGHFLVGTGVGGGQRGGEFRHVDVLEDVGLGIVCAGYGVLGKVEDEAYGFGVCSEIQGVGRRDQVEGA